MVCIIIIRSHTNYTLAGLKQNIPNGLDSVTITNIHNHFRKVRHFMFGYLLGVSAGPELKNMFKNARKSMHLINVSVSMSNGLKLSIFFSIHLFLKKTSVILFLLRFVVLIEIMVTDYLFF